MLQKTENLREMKYVILFFIMFQQLKKNSFTISYIMNYNVGRVILYFLLWIQIYERGFHAILNSNWVNKLKVFYTPVKILPLISRHKNLKDLNLCIERRCILYKCALDSLATEVPRLKLFYLFSFIS